MKKNGFCFRSCTLSSQSCGNIIQTYRLEILIYSIYFVTKPHKSAVTTQIVNKLDFRTLLYLMQYRVCSVTHSEI